MPEPAEKAETEATASALKDAMLMWYPAIAGPAVPVENALPNE
jgi:hypothetical protein